MLAYHQTVPWTLRGRRTTFGIDKQPAKEPYNPTEYGDIYANNIYESISELFNYDSEDIELVL